MKVSKDIISSIFFKLSSMGMGFIYTALVVRILGDEKYGVWATIISLLAWVDMCDIGIGNGLRNLLAQELEKKNNKNGQILVSSAYKTLSRIAVLMLIVFLIIILFVNWNKALGYSGNDLDLRFILMSMLFFVIVNFILSLYKSILYAIQKAYIVMVSSTLVNLLNIVSILVLGNKCSLLYLTIAYGININIVSLATSIYLYAGEYAMLRPKRNLYAPKIASEISSLGLQFFVIQVTTWIINFSDNLLIANYYGSKAVTPYSLINNVVMVIIGMSIVAINPLWSAFTRAQVQGQYEWMNNIIKKFFILFIFLSMGLAVLSKIMPFIIKIWTGIKVEASDRVIVFLCVYAGLRIWCSFYSMLANGMGIIKENMRLAILQGVINIPISIFLSQQMNMGVLGIIMGTNIVLIIGAIYLPFVVNKKVYQIKRENI